MKRVFIVIGHHRPSVRVGVAHSLCLDRVLHSQHLLLMVSNAKQPKSSEVLPIMLMHALI